MQLVTKSALVDEIRNVWKSYKDELDYPVAGDYYYHNISNGIFFNQTIEIPLKHLPREVYEQLDQLDTETVKYIFFRVVREIFAEKYGSKLTEQAIKENRMRLRLV